MNKFKRLKVFKTTIPTNTGQSKIVEVYSVLIVFWWARITEYSSGLEKRSKAFLQEQDAYDFKEALKNAYALLEHTSGTDVWIEEQK